MVGSPGFFRCAALGARPSGEPPTLSCHHFRLVCKEWAAAGLKVLSKVRVRVDWAQLSAPHLQAAATMSAYQESR
jgi:hypothetical protein